MFTGLVAGRGLVHEVRSAGPALRLTVRAPADFGSDGRVGESVAVNGCCLTAVAIDQSLWTFEAGSETLSKTNLGTLRPGVDVNLERALCVHDRLGRHFVQGHVDGVAQVDYIEPERDWAMYWFRAAEPLLELMVPKGSVAVDGVSLTVVQVADGRFNTALIPHTLATTTLGLRKPGDLVNIETDLLGKYVRKFLAARS